ncbi:MAG: NUDIX domain-containing protein [Gemmatimonadota bacterium]
MNKPIRCSVAAVVRGGEEGEFLVVRRPPDDQSLPDVWGLPAVTLQPDELPEAGLRRVGREKLCVGLDPVRLLGIRAADRGDYELILMDIEADVVDGSPDVHRADTTATRYVDQRWTEDIEILVDAATRGSLCSQILLDHFGFPY